VNKKNLAYIALLAGWLFFCYWLYAKEIFPLLNQDKEKSLPTYLSDLPYPFAFNWASDMPLAGNGFEEWKAHYTAVDSMDAIFIIRGYYFQDEENSMPLLLELAQRRIENASYCIGISEERVVSEILPQQVNVDVRTHPFEAIRIERISMAELVKAGGDTMELCFPLKDSIRIPAVMLERLDDWLSRFQDEQKEIAHVVGTADGSGIAESTDVAFERAMVIKEHLKKEGWKDAMIQLSTGQRSHPNSLRNRCVIIYFE
jgi:hypothetical protein